MTLRIAAFDSGVGGLTAVAPLLKRHPSIEVTYLGDLANLPYGTKSPERIRELTDRNISWLLNHSPEAGFGFDLLVIACNTASAQALAIAQRIAQQKNIPCVGVIEPGCKAALRSSERILVLATSSTVQSQSYTQQLKNLGAKVPVVQLACPLFVPLVEEGLQDSPAATWIVHHYLDSVIKKGDAVILGCTHYPFLVNTLSKEFPNTEWIDAGGALINDPTVLRVLGAATPNHQAQGSLKVYLTDKTTSLERLQGFTKGLGLDGIKLQLDYLPAL